MSSTTSPARAARRFCGGGCGSGHVERTLALYQRHGLLALMVPALLPPPAPFKLFVLAAGVADVRPLQFVTAIAVARGARYLALGVLAIYYGDAALELMRTHGPQVAPRGWSALIVPAAVAWWLLAAAARDAACPDRIAVPSCRSSSRCGTKSRTSRRCTRS